MLLNSRKIGLIVAVFLAAAVGGCASSGGVKTAADVGQVPISQAFMVPPPGGPAIIAVLEQRYRNGLAQDIILENNSGAPGQNVLYVRAYGPMGPDAGEGTMRQDIPTVSDISRELRSRFPGIGMQISGLYAQNRYGPIGYATGRTGNVNCLYVWQRLAAERGLFSKRVGAITWRLRLCDPNTSMRDLLLTAYGFSITGTFLSDRWNPFGDPPEPDPRIGQPGVAILPEQPVDPTVVAPNSFGRGVSRGSSRPRRTVRRAAVSRPAPAPDPTPLNDPLPGAAVVPRPENTDLSEPTVQGSNLPATAPRANGGGLSVPQPSGGTTPSFPVPGGQSPTVAPPQAPTVAPQASGVRSPQVRVIEGN